MKMFPADMLRDTKLLSNEYFGCWHKLLYYMHEEAPYRGTLSVLAENGTIERMASQEVSRLLDENEAYVKQLLSKLLMLGIASQDEETGIIYNRRMKREEELHRSLSTRGRKGGKKSGEVRRSQAEARQEALFPEGVEAKTKIIQEARCLDTRYTTKAREILGRYEPIQAVKIAARTASSFTTGRDLNHVFNKGFDPKIEHFIRRLGVKALVEDLLSLEGKGIEWTLHYCMVSKEGERIARWEDAALQAQREEMSAEKAEEIGIDKLLERFKRDD